MNEELFIQIYTKFSDYITRLNNKYNLEDKELIKPILCYIDVNYDIDTLVNEMNNSNLFKEKKNETTI